MFHPYPTQFGALDENFSSLMLLVISRPSKICKALIREKKNPPKLGHFGSLKDLGVNWTPPFDWFIYLLPCNTQIHMVFKFLCIHKYIRRSQNQFHEVLEVILNCQEFSISIDIEPQGHIGPPPIMLVNKFWSHSPNSFEHVSFQRHVK